MLMITKNIIYESVTELICCLADSNNLLMILTGGKFATRRADGVHVVPIGCLRP